MSDSEHEDEHGHSEAEQEDCSPFVPPTFTGGFQVPASFFGPNGPRRPHAPNHGHAPNCPTAAEIAKRKQWQKQLEKLVSVRVDIMSQTREAQSVGDELSDLTILCKGDKSFRAERSMLARSSDVFFKMLTTQMTETQTGIIKLPEFELTTVQRCYRLIVQELLQPRLEPPNHCATDELLHQFPCRSWFKADRPFDEIAEDLRFAQMYNVNLVLRVLRRYLVSIVPTQVCFDIDQTFRLGLRKALLWNVLLHFSVGQQTIILGEQSTREVTIAFSDLHVYNELKELIFSTRSAKNQREQKAWASIQKSFIDSFAEAKFHPKDLGLAVRQLDKNEVMRLAEGIKSLEERWEFVKSALADA